MGNNFKCTSCHKEFLIPSYSFQINNGIITYKDKQTGCNIKCPVCLLITVTSIQRKSDLSTVMYGAFSSANEEDKKAMLHKRAKLAMRKDAEQRHELNTHFHGRCNEAHY